MALKPNGYISCIVDNRVVEDPDIYGTLSIEGPKNCGKTWAARNLLKIKGMFEESEKAVRRSSFVLYAECHPRHICVRMACMSYRLQCWVHDNIIG